MKNYSFKLNEFQLDKFSSPIREKIHVIDILMRAIKIMTLNSIGSKETAGEIILYVSKMSRLFFILEDKYYSINFPFSVHKNDNTFSFYFLNDIEIDNKLSSDVLGFLTTFEKINNNTLDSFLDSIADYEGSESLFWSLIYYLFTFEDGYIRYDYDEKHQDGSIHPLNHYDIFYSSNSTFKIGLNERIPKETLIDLLNLNSDCHFFKKIS